MRLSGISRIIEAEVGIGFLLYCENTICHKMWEHRERNKNSTWRELSAIQFSLRSLTELLKSTHVKWLTDSQAAAKIVEVGSMKFELHMLTKSHWIFNGFQVKGPLSLTRHGSNFQCPFSMLPQLLLLLNSRCSVLPEKAFLL